MEYLWEFERRGADLVRFAGSPGADRVAPGANEAGGEKDERGRRRVSIQRRERADQLLKDCAGLARRLLHRRRRLSLLKARGPLGSGDVQTEGWKTPWRELSYYHWMETWSKKAEAQIRVGIATGAPRRSRSYNETH